MAPIYQDTCEHTYQNGVCTICDAEDPHWVVPADKDILPLTLDTPSTSSDSAYCVWYQFTAPETNFYRFQASGSTNIMGHSYYSLDDVNFNIGDPSDESFILPPFYLLIKWKKDKLFTIMYEARAMKRFPLIQQ